jgi:hypothetical protein
LYVGRLVISILYRELKTWRNHTAKKHALPVLGGLDGLGPVLGRKQVVRMAARGQLMRYPENGVSKRFCNWAASYVGWPAK